MPRQKRIEYGLPVKVGVRFVALLLCLPGFALGSDIAYAGESAPKRDYVGPRAGLMWGTATIGMEFQRGRAGLLAGYSLLVGVAGGVNYYFNPRDDSWFAGGYAFYLDEDEKDVTSIGLSGGYRWRFDSMWELSLGVGVGYAEEAEGASTKESIVAGPTISIGYSFRVKK